MAHVLWVLICIVAVMIFVVGIAGEGITLFSGSREKAKATIRMMFSIVLALMVTLILLLIAYVGMS